MSLSIDYRVITFFDRSPVLEEMQRRRRGALRKAGAFIRQRAKTSIRKGKRKKPSDLPPDELKRYEASVARAAREGKPPPKLSEASAKPGQPPVSHEGGLRRLIRFELDDHDTNVVIGPELSKQQSPPAPGLLEHGGTTRRGRNTLKYEKHPFMLPALEAEAPQFLELLDWKR